MQGSRSYLAHIFLGMVVGTGLSMANVRYERNLEEFGFSPTVESYRQKVSLDLKNPVSAISSAKDIPGPALPPLENNYSNLVPPPTQPKSRRYFQPRAEDLTPQSRQQFQEERSDRIRDYKRPPAFNPFLGAHKNIPEPIWGNTSYGLTGLHRTISAQILPKENYRFFSGVALVDYDRSFGSTVPVGKLTKYTIPVGVAGRISDDFEMALSANIVNEKSSSFPLLNDFEKTDLEEIQMMSKFQFANNPAYGLKAAFGFGVQHALDKQVTRRGSDGSSYLGFISLSKEYERYTLHGQLGYTSSSGTDPAGKRQSSSLVYNLGAEIASTSRTSFTVEMNGLDWSGYGSTVDITLGARYKLREEVNLEFFVPMNVMDARLPYEYDHYIHAGVNVRL